ncbi:MAG: BamA/TamA family outer membrane protein [Candidatus Omnitrophica bacterium]|nr:BamA/TamA family outer membrane protein [Candidatus Omnitrophota bacterium]
MGADKNADPIFFVPNEKGKPISVMQFFKKTNDVSRLFFFLTFLLLAQATPLSAQEEIPYDPYAPVFKYPEAVQLETARARDRNRLLARVLEQPLRPVGYGLGKTAEWVERKHMDDKVIWFFDELHSHGIYPKLKGPTTGSFGTVGLEGRVEFEKLLQLEQPYVSLEGFGGWTPNKDFDGTTVEAGGRYRLESPTTAILHDGEVRYSRSSAESFFGIGQDTSLGEYSTYQPEELKFSTGLGYPFAQTVDGRANFVYQRMNIGNGNRERVGKIKEHFPIASVPGINGGDLIGLVASLIHDNRDHKNDAKRGGREALEFSYFHDTDGNDFHYLKVAGSVSHFFSIFSDRRIFAARLVAEKNQELGGDEIPFFNLSRLGGSDRSDGSELLRSYRYNRFFEEGLLAANFEYRYNIYEYSDFASDAFILFDVGEVFGELGDFGLEELKFSYGGGFNVKFRRRTIFSVAIARGNEGWNVGTHTKVSF